MNKPTRAALMDHGMLLPGEKIEISPYDGYPLAQMQIIKFDGQNWQLQGSLIEEKAG